MNSRFYLIFAVIGGYILFKVLSGVFALKRAKNISLIEAGREHVKQQFSPTDRVDKKTAEVAPPKSLGGQPMYYNQVDHTFGRFLALFRTDADMADARIIHNNCFRVRYLKDVTYFWFIKASREEVTPCVFRPGIDVESLAPGQEAGVPSEGLVVLKRSMDGQRLATGDGERYRSMLLGEKSYSKMLADMLIWVQDKQRLAHMDPGSKEYVDDMVAMIKRTKQIHEAASQHRPDSFGLTNPYPQEMYGNEDTSAQMGSGENSLWRLG